MATEDALETARQFPIEPRYVWRLRLAEVLDSYAATRVAEALAEAHANEHNTRIAYEAALAEARAQERERCANSCELLAAQCGEGSNHAAGMKAAYRRAAQLIRVLDCPITALMGVLRCALTLSPLDSAWQPP